jgi:hypothetical protein
VKLKETEVGGRSDNIAMGSSRDGGCISVVGFQQTESDILAGLGKLSRL